MTKFYLFLIAIIITARIKAQGMMQDSTLNNLIYPQGYQTCNLGDLGKVSKTGKGKTGMIVIAGFGFGEDAYEGLANAFKTKYTVYIVTPAGFGKTPGPVMPSNETKYNEMTWTNGIAKGILELIEKEKLIRPVVIAHHITATQVAFKLGIDNSDKIGKLIIISGSPYRYYGTRKSATSTEFDWTKEMDVNAERRSAITEKWWAPKWFKTVTKKTWDDNMWKWEDYCKDSIKGSKLFDETADVLLPVDVRYMLEWGAYDASDKYSRIKVPTLVLYPDFKGLLSDNPADSTSCRRAEAKAYLNYYHKDIWKKAKDAGNPNLKFKEIYDTRIFIWYDNPKSVKTEISNFLK